MSVTGPQTPALAERGGRKEQDDRLLAQDVREVVAMHVVGRDAGVDLRDVGDLAGGQRLDRRRPLANLWHRVVTDRIGRREQAVLEGAAGLDQGRELPGPGLVEGDVGDVGDLRGSRIVGGRLGLERGLGGEVLDPRREGADRLPVDAPARSRIQRDLGVGDLLAAGSEDAEGEPVGAQVEEARRGRHDGALRVGGGDDLPEASCPARRGSRRPRARACCGCRCRCPSRRIRRPARRRVARRK